jgi:molybdopterin-guanine dinucleotide biosynthesis protein A
MAIRHGSRCSIFLSSPTTCNPSRVRAGILAGLDWIAAHRPDVEFAISAAANTPFLPDYLAARLKDGRAKNNVMVACARSGGRTHPLATLRPVAIRREQRQALVEKDMRKAEDFLHNYHRATVDWPVEPFDPYSMSTNQTISRRRKQFSPGAKPILPKAAS